MHKESLHSTAKSLLASHDQSSWVIKDGLICAPIGFFRFLEQFKEDPNETAKTVAFAFEAEKLDKIPHPLDPTRTILREPAYVTKPLTATEAEIWGALQNTMEDQQGKWLLFNWRAGNLYYSDRREQGRGEYFSNGIFRYHILPKQNASGNVSAYHVAYHADPYNKEDGFDVDQELDGHWGHSFGKREIFLGSFPTRDEALRFIHEDDCARFESLVDNKEILRWSDPDIIGNVSMWGHNYAANIARQPLSIGSAATKLVDLVLKLSPAGIMFGVWIDRLEKRAEEARQDARGIELKNIAEVEEGADRPVPFYLMKEEAREHWVTIDNPAPPLLRAPLPECEDLESYKRKRMVDIINGYYPVLVRKYVCDSQHSFIMARERHGMQILIVDDGADPANHCTKRYITYAKCRTAQPGMPLSLKPLFSDNENLISCIEKRQVTADLADGETVFYKPHKDAKYHFVHHFVKMDDITPGLSEQLVTALHRHRKPEFLPANQNEPIAGPEQLSAFRRCKEVLWRYGAVALPTTTERARDCVQVYGMAAAGAVAAFAPLSAIITADVRSSVPLIFAAAAALMTKNMGKNCSTPRGTTRFNVVASGILSSGLLTFVYRTGINVQMTFIQDGLRAFTDQDIDEKICGTMGALFLGVPALVNATRIGLRAFRRKTAEMHLMQSQLTKHMSANTPS